MSASPSEPIPVRPGLAIPQSDLTWRFSRSSGPGGQSVNTADSRVSLSFDVANSKCLSDYLRERALQRLGKRLVDGVLTVHAEQERSQYLNRLKAAARLAEIVRDAVAPPKPKRRATKPTKGSGRRRLEAKKQRGAIKKLRGSVND